MALDLIYKGDHLAQDLPYLVNAPIGAIMIWSGAEDTVPEGWSICNGENGTLDLRDRFVLSAGDVHEVGETGGSEEVTLTLEQMPRHNHTYSGNSTTYNSELTNSSSGKKVWIGTASTRNTGSTPDGNAEPHPNMPPYYTALYIQKTGVTPSDYATVEQVEEVVSLAISDAIEEAY